MSICKLSHDVVILFHTSGERLQVVDQLVRSGSGVNYLVEHVGLEVIELHDWKSK